MSATAAKVSYAFSIPKEQVLVGKASRELGLANLWCSSRPRLLLRSFHIQASNSNKNSQIDDPLDPTSAFTSQEDLIYLVKLGAASVVGAGVIKYGSIFFPEITRPNILQALLMISTPVIVAVFLLIKQSRAEQRR